MRILRIAPLIRVSTEAQEEKGESLNTQKQQILRYVEHLNGQVVSWDYSGQEHATPDQERKKLEKLLKDASLDIFDAVMVCDLSRWSRDNRRSKDGLDILKANRIRFFVGPTEYNLDSPEQSLFIGMATEINEFFAKNQSLKSLESRITRAKRNIPTTGKLPYGRTWTKEGGWGVDVEKLKTIQLAAERYLAGESMAKIAASLGMNHSNLWKILTKRSGSDWDIVFDNNRFKINETVTIKIPPLLSQEVIDSIFRKAADNKTFTHGQLKHKYLLGRVVFCAECGNAMFGQTNHGNRRYYRHARGRINKCNPQLWIPALDLENAIIINLFAMFGDVVRLEKAVEQATPDAKKMDELSSRLVDIGKTIADIKRQKNNVITAISEGIIENDEARSKMEKLRERETALTEEKNRIDYELSTLPDYRKQLSNFTRAIKKLGYLSIAYHPETLGKLTFEDKRKIVQAAFNGKNPTTGERLGVYVSKVEDTWHYDIRGIIPKENFEFSSREPLLQGRLPMTKWQAQFILGVDTDHCDFNPLESDNAEVTKCSLSCKGPNLQ